MTNLTNQYNTMEETTPETTPDLENPLAESNEDIKEEDILKDFEKEFKAETANKEEVQKDQPKAEAEHNKDEAKPEGSENKKRKSLFSKQEETKTEATESPEPVSDDAPDHISDKQGWKELKSKHAGEIEDYKRQLKEASINSPEYKKLQEEHAMMSKQLSEKDFANSPEFYNKYKKPMESGQIRMIEILKDAGLDEDYDLSQIFQKGERDQKQDIGDISDELSKFDGREFEDCYRELLRLNREAGTALADSDTARDNIRSENTFNQEKAVKESWDKMTNSGNVFLQEIDPVDPNDQASVDRATAYNNALSRIPYESAQNANKNINEQGIADLCNMGEMGKFIMTHGLERIQAEFDSVETELSNAKAELASIRSNNPNINGSKEGQRAEQTRKEPQTEEDVLDQFERDFKKEFSM